MSKLKQIFLKAKERTLLRYLFVGGSSYIIELSSLLLIFHFTGLRSLATAIAFAIGFCMAFVFQKLIAFKDYDREAVALTKQGLKYSLLNAFNYIFTVAFVTLFPDKYLIISRTVALVMMSSWNYVLYKKVIFKNKKVNVPV